MGLKYTLITVVTADRLPKSIHLPPTARKHGIAMTKPEQGSCDVEFLR